MKIRLAAVAVLSCAARLRRSQRRAVVERVVAVVNDEIILETELEQYARRNIAGPIPTPREGKKAWDELKRKALDGMIDSRLVQQQAVELKLSVTPDEVDRAIEEVKEQNKLDDATFREALEQQGFTLEGYRKKLKKQILELKVVNTAVRSRVTVSDDEVQDLLQAERAAAGRRRSAVAPAPDPGRGPPDRASDADVAAQASGSPPRWSSWRAAAPASPSWPSSTRDDDGTKTSGGDLGWVGKGVLVDALDEAMAAMEPGDVRGPIRTDRGWVVLQLVERKSGDMRPYDEIKEQLRKQLYDQQVEKAQQSWLRELRKKAHVDVRLASRAASREHGRQGRADGCGARSGPLACRR